MGSDETGLDYERIVTVQAPAAVASCHCRGTCRAGRRCGRVCRLAATTDFPDAAAARHPSGGRHAERGLHGRLADYFDTLGVRVLHGRGFTRAEAEQHAALILVSEATARLFWPGRDPIDQKLDIAPPLTDRHRQPAVMRATVIGIVEDVVNGTLLDGVARTSV